MAADGNSNGPQIDVEMKDGLRQKRREFRDYLETTGTLDALTRGLVALYENPVKPDNPVAFFMEHLSLGVSLKAELEALKRELSDVREKLAEAITENIELRSALTVRRSTGSGQGFEELLQEPLLREEKGQAGAGTIAAGATVADTAAAGTAGPDQSPPKKTSLPAEGPQSK